MDIGQAVAVENDEVSLPQINQDELDAIGIAYGEANKKLIEFVTKNIDLMKSHLLNERLLDLSHVNKAYLDYLPVSMALANLYQKVFLNARKANQELEAFDDEAVDSTKRELTREAEQNKAFKFSATELKSAAHVKYKAKYAQLHAKADLAEARRSFIEKLCKIWDSWQYGLGQLSRNMIAEANANGLDIKGQNFAPPDPDDGNMDRMVDQAMQFSQPRGM